MKFNHKSFSIGVEIEMTGLSRREAANIVSDFFGNGFEYMGGKTDMYTIQDEYNRVWKIEGDDSILPQRISNKGVMVRASEEYKVELVSPILYYGDIPLIQELVRTLKMYGKAIVNDSTGIHIHVGAYMFTAENIITLCNILYSKQPLIEKSLMYSHRKRYCDSLSSVLIEKLNKLKPKTINELADIWYGVPHQSDYSRANYYHHSRYRILNIHQFLSQRQKTIEFRMFNGSLDEEVILANIQFSTLIAAQSLSQKRALYRETVPISGNEKYAFRVWLLKLGAIGQEYKTMRLLLLKYLEGDSAWR